MEHYIIQVIAFQLLFLVIYDVLFRKETFFNLNRVYLLGTAIVSFIIPFIKIEWFEQVVTLDLGITLPEVFIGSTSESGNTLSLDSIMQPAVFLGEDSISIWTIIFFLGVCIALTMLVLKISKLLLLVSKSKKQWNANVHIVTLNNSTKAFSFFNYVFLGEQLKANEKESILKHEMVHVQQKHSLDLLLFEMLRIVFWFNPLVYLYQNRIATLHEYIADAKAIKYHDTSKYYDNLLSQVFDTQQFSFVNPFFKQSLIKKRIVMLSKSRSQKINLSKYLIIVPLLLGMLVYTSCSIFKKKNDKVEVTTETSVLEKVEVPFAVVDQVPVYKSCEGLQINVDRKKCVSEQISKHVNKHFNTSIADSLSLTGKQRIMVAFKIDKQGYVTGVRARAPHPKLELEAKRVVESLPQFVPGKHKGKAVVVPYSLPIVFQVQGKTDSKKTSNPLSTERVQELKEKFKNADEVPFMALDRAPGTETCNNMTTEKESKACFSKFISMYVNKSFNIDLATKLGLEGRQRINVLFKVDKEGHVTGARARAPHPDLEKEALRVINSLPEFSPGEMNGKPVIVNYSLPIIFQIANPSNNDKKN
ncbi:energy transducer TonB [Psychroserpens sp. MEBiC05023]